MTEVLPGWLQPVWTRLTAAIANDRLHHALLLAGPPHIGKHRLAESLVQLLMCEHGPQLARDAALPCGQCHGCRQYLAGTHPDCLVLTTAPELRRGFRQYPEQPSQVEANKRSKQLQRRIRIDQVRDALKRLETKAHQGGRRVVVVSPAEAIGYNAANALLKLVEEPAPGTLFLFLGDAPGLLPATLRSRCLWQRCEAPDQATALDWLGEQYPEAQRRQALSLAAGGPLLAADILADENHLLRRLAAALSALAGGKAASRKGTRDPVELALEFAREGYDELLAGFTQLLLLAGRWVVAGRKGNVSDPRDGLTGVDDLRCRMAGVDLRQLLALQDSLYEVRRAGAVSLNQRLLLESFLFRWQRLFRT